MGPALEKVLLGAGVTSFERLAAMSVEQVQGVLPDLHDSRVEREDWLGQARRLADAKAGGVDPATVTRANQVR